MKHENAHEDVRIRVAALGVQLSEAQAGLLSLHLAEVLEATKLLNLTAIREWDRAVVAHIEDSLLALPEVAALPDGDVVDLGSGAGYPGVPLAIVTGRRFLLLEAVRKKAAFLEGLVRRLELERVAVSPCRAEELARERPRAFAGVVARAVAPLDSLCELAAPLLGPGGSLVALKGRLADAEMEEALSTASVVGLELESVRTAALGAEGAARTIVTFGKRGEPRVVLPRRPGAAQKRPVKEPAK